jgi:hypothetical protein
MEGFLSSEQIIPDVPNKVNMPLLKFSQKIQSHQDNQMKDYFNYYKILMSIPLRFPLRGGPGGLRGLTRTSALCGMPGIFGGRGAGRRTMLGA